MPKLKSLRGAIGAYGRVAANGIVEVSEAEAEQLLKTKRFVKASAADIKAAQDRREAESAVDAVGAAPGFSAMPAPPGSPNRLSQMVADGRISQEKAQELIDLQIELSPEEIQGFLKDQVDAVASSTAAAQAELAAREADLANRVAEEDARLQQLQADLDALQADIDHRQAELEQADAAAKSTDGETGAAPKTKK